MSKPQWKRRETMISELEAVLALLRAGQIDDLAIVAMQGPIYPPYVGFMQPPKNPEALMAKLAEVSSWVGNAEKHAEFSEQLEVIG